MYIICNGIPRSGTHALVKAVELLGIPQSWDVDTWDGHSALGNVSASIGIHAHIDVSAVLPPNVIHIFIVRRPQNIIVSNLRSKSVEVSDETLARACRSYENGLSAVEYMRWFIPSLKAATHIVRFERLVSDDGKTMKALADHIGGTYTRKKYNKLPGFTRTWSGKLSNWKTAWGPKAAFAWKATGGPEIEKELGYVS